MQAMLFQNSFSRREEPELSYMYNFSVSITLLLNLWYGVRSLRPTSPLAQFFPPQHFPLIFRFEPGYSQFSAEKLSPLIITFILHSLSLGSTRAT